MDELTAYHYAFCGMCSHGDGRTPEDCACHGSGWLLSEVDTWHHCPDHYTGQGYPEDIDED